jgi:hypothetical protein
VPQMVALTSPEAKRLEAIGSRTGGFDLMGAVRVRPRHANHGTQTVWVCVPRFVGIVSERMQGCLHRTSSPPLGDLFPPCAVDSFPVRRRNRDLTVHFSGRRGRRPLRSYRSSSADETAIEPFICARI